VSYLVQNIVARIVVRVTTKGDYGFEVLAEKIEEAIHNHKLDALLALQ